MSGPADPDRAARPHADVDTVQRTLYIAPTMTLRIISLFAVLVSFTSTAGADELQARLQLAKEWLTVLGVSYTGDIGPGNTAALRVALKDWHDHIGRDSDSGKEDDKARLPGEVPQYLLPSVGERLLRLSNFNSEFLRTPNYVQGTVLGQSGPPSFIPNPDHGLLTLGGTMTLSELYSSLSERNELCKMVQSIWNETAVGHSGYCDGNFLLGKRTGDAFARFASGITIKTAVSEVPRFQNGVDISNTPLAANNKWTPVVTGTFDPATVFRTPADWKIFTKYKVFATGKNLPDDKVDPLDAKQQSACPHAELADWNSKDHHVEATDDPFVRACFEAFLYSSRRRQAVISFLPKVDVKATTPFDAVKTGSGTFIQPPAPGKTIYDVTLTWDLRRLFASGSNRQDALSGYKTFELGKADKEAADNPQSDSAELAWRQRVWLRYMELAATPAVADDPAWWNAFRAVVYREEKVGDSIKTASIAAPNVP
jgi:hypothetical protein